MRKELLDEIFLIYRSYDKLHFRMSRLDEKAKSLAKEQAELSYKLNETRNAEKILINKIEEELGVQVTANDLLSFIKSKLVP